MTAVPNDFPNLTPDESLTSAPVDTQELGRDGLLKVLSQRVIDAARTGEAVEAKAYLDLLDYLQEVDWDMEVGDAQSATALLAARQTLIDELSEALDRLHGGSQRQSSEKPEKR
jgi:hypothetical protein